MYPKINATPLITTIKISYMFINYAGTVCYLSVTPLYLHIQIICKQKTQKIHIKICSMWGIMPVIGSQGDDKKFMKESNVIPLFVGEVALTT